MVYTERRKGGFMEDSKKNVIKEICACMGNSIEEDVEGLYFRVDDGSGSNAGIGKVRIRDDILGGSSEDVINEIESLSRRANIMYLDWLR